MIRKNYPHVPFLHILRTVVIEKSCMTLVYYASTILGPCIFLVATVTTVTTSTSAVSSYTIQGNT